MRKHFKTRMKSKIEIKILLSIIMVCMVSFCSGQLCKDYHKGEDCYVFIPLNRDFKMYNQAKSQLVEVEKSIINKIILYGGKDYIVGICSEGAYYRKIRLRIIDGITKKVIYDNSDYDFIESFLFTVVKTQPLEMEVTVLSDDKAAINKKVCVGFKILYSDTLSSEENGK